MFQKVLNRQIKLARDLQGNLASARSDFRFISVKKNVHYDLKIGKKPSEEADFNNCYGDKTASMIKRIHEMLH